eukprot:5083263-Alexandrium_andersonii.AAC.1
MDNERSCRQQRKRMRDSFDPMRTQLSRLSLPPCCGTQRCQGTAGGQATGRRWPEGTSKRQSARGRHQRKAHRDERAAAEK